MSRTHQDGHGRCVLCGDAGESRRKREELHVQQDLLDGILCNQDRSFQPFGLLCCTGSSYFDDFDDYLDDEYPQLQGDGPLRVRLEDVARVTWKQT